MKIAVYEFSVAVFPGGIQTTCWETAKRLARLGHDVHMYSGEGSIRWEMPENVKLLIFPFIPRAKFPDFGTRFRKFAERISFGVHTVRSLIENRYDIIYIRKPYEMPISLYVKQRTGARVVFRSGGTEFFPGYGVLAKRLDAFLSCSRNNARQIQEYCGIEPGVLYNGVDTERFSPLPKNREIMASYGFREDDFILMSVARLVGWKGIQYALQSLKVLDNKKIKYLIVGDGEYRNDLVQVVRRSSIDDRVVFAGTIDNKNLPLYYSVADVVLFPTIGDDDAFPNALCEAMACGKPAVGTTKGGIPEAIVDGITGFLVPPADVPMLAEKITILCSDDRLRQDMGSNARQRVIDLFSWDMIVKKLEEVFYSLMK